MVYKIKSKVQLSDGGSHKDKSTSVHRKCASHQSALTTTKTKTTMVGPDESSPVKLRREIGLLEGVAITIGSIIGSGIFVSPKGVLAACGSVGLSLIIWIACGFLSMSGALCYAELGTTFPGSGGTYHYLSKAYGPTVAFLFFWISIMITAPCSMAILSLTFSKYVTQVFFTIGCELPGNAISLLAACTIFLIIFLNCYDVRKTVKAQNVFMVTKVAALTLIIVAGLVYLLQGHTENFSNPFENTITDPGSIALAFYSGFFSYGGWAALNFMTEELKEPNKNLPRAIYISIPLVTLIYVLANTSYFAVLTAPQVLLSDAIAISFGQKLFGSVGWVMSLFVAISVFGALTIHTMASSRLLFVAAREGHCPTMLSHIKVEQLTPTPSLIFLGFLSLFYLSTSNIYALINYASFIDGFAQIAVVIAMLNMRRRDPDLPRPIKVSLFYPIVYLVICTLAVALPVYIRPVETVSAIIIAITGLPFYYLFVLRDLPTWFSRIIDKLTCLSQKLFMSVSED